MLSILPVAVAALSSLLLQAPPSPGSTVTITASPAGCASATSVQVWAVTLNAVPPSGPTETFRLMTHLAPDGGPLRVSLTFVSGRAIESGTCQWTFDRLPPSEYVALLAGPPARAVHRRSTCPATPPLLCHPPRSRFPDVS
jgi:hypothetical protein